MQLYFVKATYTNNVYKISDFFLNGAYKLDANKMLDINGKIPNDGISSFITSKLTLPDTTSIREHTHIIVPDYNKIFEISDIAYLNATQLELRLTEDTFLSEYIELETEDLILHRTNDPDLFRGTNDIADLNLEDDVFVKTIESDHKTGKYALLFFQYNDDVDYIGLVFEGTQKYEEWPTLNDILTAYPEVTTTNPTEYDYFQKIVTDVGTGNVYQCVFDNTGGGQLSWVRYFDIGTTTTKLYIKKAGTGVNVGSTKISPAEVRTICVALPLESDLFIGTDRIVEYTNFVGPEDSTLLLDIKIVDSLLIKNSTITYNPGYLGTRTMQKTLTFANQSTRVATVYNANTVSPADIVANTGWMIMYDFESDIDISANFGVTTTNPLNAEPFYKYELYVFGKQFRVPYYLTNDIHLLISVVSGVINYIIYYEERRNIVASGSFTHSIKYQVDQLDSFYSQNPTYKEQFYAQIGINSLKSVVGGAVAGSAVPGLGTLTGAGVGAVNALVDAGVGMMNLNYMEKNLTLKPDQVFGEISEVTLQLINIFGVYWVRKQSENIDLMRIEYDLRGFPHKTIKKISELDYQTSSIFPATAKVVFGELKTVIKNKFVTKNINEKLLNGVILVP